MKTMKQLERDSFKMSYDYKQFKIARIKMIGVIAVEDAKENFKNQSTPRGHKWEERTKSTNRAYDKRGLLKGSVYSSSSPILLQTGNLRDSIRWGARGLTKVFVGLDLGRFPGAKLLNEGGYGLAWGKHRFHMNSREFLGWSPRLRDKIRKKLKYEYDKTFQAWR